MFNLVRARPRRTLRRAFSTRCRAVRLNGFRLVGERILDLSPRGAMIACDTAVAEGDQIIVSFRAPNDGPVIDAMCEVSRVIQGWRNHDPGYCAGVRFVEIDKESRDEILVRLAGVPPPIPGRPVLRDYASTIFRLHESRI